MADSAAPPAPTPAVPEKKPMKTRKPYVLTAARKEAFERCRQARAQQLLEKEKLKPPIPEDEKEARAKVQDLKREVYQLERAHKKRTASTEEPPLSAEEEKRIRNEIEAKKWALHKAKGAAAVLVINKRYEERHAKAKEQAEKIVRAMEAPMEEEKVQSDEWEDMEEEVKEKNEEKQPIIEKMEDVKEDFPSPPPLRRSSPIDIPVEPPIPFSPQTTAETSDSELQMEEDPEYERQVRKYLRRSMRASQHEPTIKKNVTFRNKSEKRKHTFRYYDGDDELEMEEGETVPVRVAPSVPTTTAPAPAPAPPAPTGDIHTYPSPATIPPPGMHASTGYWDSWAIPRQRSLYATSRVAPPVQQYKRVRDGYRADQLEFIWM